MAIVEPFTWEGASIETKSGNTTPWDDDLTETLNGDTHPLDLTECVVWVWVADALTGAIVVEGERAILLDPTQGKVRFQPNFSHVAQARIAKLEWQVSKRA